MTTIANQAVKIGIFLITVTAILLLALAVMGGLRFWRPVHIYYVVTDQAVSGIVTNSAVTLRGVDVGKVGAIELDPESFDQVRIELEIDPDVLLPVGSKAYFERVGLTGERAINIGGGTLAAGQLLPGSEIPRGQTQLEQLESRAEQIGDDLTTLVAELTETVREVEAVVAAIDPERVAGIIEAVEPARVEAIVAQTEAATETLAATSRSLRRAVGEARADMRAITNNVDDVARSVDEKLEEISADATKVLDSADTAARSLTETIDDADALIEANERDLRRTLRNFRRASEDARALMEAVREKPSLLLRRESRRDRKRRR